MSLFGRQLLIVMTSMLLDSNFRSQAIEKLYLNVRGCKYPQNGTPRVHAYVGFWASKDARITNRAKQ